MLTALFVLLLSIGLLCRGHRPVALENLALRQQVAALTRTGQRPQPRPRDGLLWILKSATLVSMDFFTVPALAGRVLFVLVLLTHQRRRVIHVNITEHPTAAWTAQQMIEAFPDDTAPRWLLRDRDAIYGDVFRCRVAGMG